MYCVNICQLRLRVHQLEAEMKSSQLDLEINYFTRHTLVRAKGEVFVLLYVFLFVRSTISRQPAGRFRPTPKFACGRTLVPDVSSPLLGVSGPRRTEKGGNEIFVTVGVNGEFLHFGGFWAISQQRVDGSTPNFICIGTMSADVPPPPMGSIGPCGGGGIKNSKMGGLFVNRTATISIFLSDAKCSPICRAQTCAHSGVEP